MIQIVFTDNGKVHTVTFLGEDKEIWGNRFTVMLSSHLIEYEWRDI